MERYLIASYRRKEEKKKDGRGDHMKALDMHIGRKEVCCQGVAHLPFSTNDSVG